MTEAEIIFAAFEQFIAEDARRYRIDQKRKELAEAKRKVCGSCTKWMTSACVPEAKLKQFKSMNSVACSEFVLKSWDAERIEKLEIELAELTNAG